tara:strand:+ start:1105 stop:1749 length:645 start_codon:yes stop_codon:yes gene_type:complete
MQRGRGNIIKTQNKYASPVKQAFSTSLYDREGSLFQPVLFTGNKESTKLHQDIDEKLKPEDTSKGEDNKIIKTKKKEKKDKDKKTSGSGGGGINPELLLSTAMPFSYAIGKGLTALFGRRKSKTQEIADDGEKQYLYDQLSNLRKKQLKSDIKSDKQKIADLSSKHTIEVEPFVDKAPGIAKKQSFKEAFATARGGGKKTFMWNNEKYTTKLKK